jgi:hypothetical protein
MKKDGTGKRSYDVITQFLDPKTDQPLPSPSSKGGARGRGGMGVGALANSTEHFHLKNGDLVIRLEKTVLLPASSFWKEAGHCVSASLSVKVLPHVTPYKAEKRDLITRPADLEAYLRGFVTHNQFVKLHKLQTRLDLKASPRHRHSPSLSQRLCS